MGVGGFGAAGGGVAVVVAGLGAATGVGVVVVVTGGLGAAGATGVCGVLIYLETLFYFCGWILKKKLSCVQQKMKPLEWIFIALTLAFVTHWAFQQYRKSKGYTDQKFSLKHFAAFFVVYMVLIYFADGAFLTTKTGGSGVTEIESAVPVYKQPDTFVSKINEIVDTGLPPF